MNNNRGNNRRRGRGNNNRQNGGGQQLNRIDSRARGNAPQLLEKYRKLAHDAHLNGDRVNEEYFLQFADHYFRVIADTRTRQEESRRPRDERWQEGSGGEYDRNGDAYGDDGGEYGGGDSYDEIRAGGERERAERQERNDRQDRPERGERQDRGERQERRERQPRFEPRGEEPAPAAAEGEVAVDAAAEANPYEPPQNPFVRDNRDARGTRGLKQRRPRREAGDEAAAATETAEVPAAQPDLLDPAALPPAVSARRSAAPAEADASEEPAAEAKPRRRTRRTRPAGETDEPLQAVS